VDRATARVGNLETLEEGDALVPLGEKATIEATCVDDAEGTAALALSLNGEALLEASPRDPLGNGAPGLQAYDASAEESDERMLLAWHDFAVEPTE
jgi:hypothetical protein